MKTEIREVIEKRTTLRDHDHLYEIVELLPVQHGNGWKIVLGYMDYPRWHPVMVLKHLFPSRDRAEDLAEKIWESEDLDLQHWEVWKDPNQPELDLGLD